MCWAQGLRVHDDERYGSYAGTVIRRFTIAEMCTDVDIIFGQARAAKKLG